MSGHTFLSFSSVTDSGSACHRYCRAISRSSTWVRDVPAGPAIWTRSGVLTSPRARCSKESWHWIAPAVATMPMCESDRYAAEPGRQRSALQHVSSRVVGLPLPPVAGSAAERLVADRGIGQPAGRLLQHVGDLVGEQPQPRSPIAPEVDVGADRDGIRAVPFGERIGRLVVMEPNGAQVGTERSLQPGSGFSREGMGVRFPRRRHRCHVRPLFGCC